MKKLFITALTAAAIAACAPTTKGYKINGKYNDIADGSKIYLIELSHTNLNYLDSTTVQNGSFEFSGTCEKPAVRFLLFPHIESGEDMLPIAIENGNIEVTLGVNPTTGGSQLNEALQSYRNDNKKASQKAEEIFKSIDNPGELSTEQRDSLQNAANEIMQEVSDIILHHIRTNINNPIAPFLISINGQMCDIEQLASLIDSVPEEYRDERFNNFSSRFKSHIQSRIGAERTAEGGAYVNFELKDPSGNPVLFSSIVENNKYTLLDFWASWCSPCRKAMPGIKNIYEKYGKKGLAVVSLSLDTDSEAWKKAVSDLGMTWTQLCNPDGGSREVGQAYGVEFIPTILIIDTDGKIVSRGLEGEALAKKIDELMK